MVSSDNIEQGKSAFVEDPSIYNEPTKAIPVPEKNIGVDTNNSIYWNIVDNAQKGVVDLTAFDSFLSVSQGRDQIYSLIDTMCLDPTIAAVLETYAEDATEYNENGHIVWAESKDSQIASFVNFLLDDLNVDKYVYQWVHSLCKYGDLYLKMFRDSDYDKEDTLFKNYNSKEKKPLNEDVKLKAYSENDHYKHYVEMESNPAEVFDLIRHGKSYAYIKTDINSLTQNFQNQQIAATQNFRYRIKQNDVEVYQPTSFVHACLEDNTSRTPEEIQIFRDEDSYNSDTNASTYKVKRGQSLFYNVFKIWRELALLENSILLNRVTRSSIIRIIGVEVGDMPKEMVGPQLQRIKALMEQKEAINAGSSMSEYTNPGPIENNIYVPTHDGKGALSTQTLGGDVDVGKLTDLDYFQDKFFGALRVPKQYFGITDDNAGFSGGQSLSIISSRYAKMVKRIQNTMCQAIKDLINLLLMDKGQDTYINNFTIRMTPPTTQEEIDRRDNMSGRVQLANDIMGMVGELEAIPRLKILQELMSTFMGDNNVQQILQEEINKLEAESKKSNSEENEENAPEEEDIDISFENPEEDEEQDMMSSINNIDSGAEGLREINNEDEGRNEETSLPSPDSLGIDFTDNNQEI